MRIIAGKWRGRRLEAPDGGQTRPILDRAKTVLFDVLGNRLAEPGSLPPIAVMDLFAGSGALGLEALSRGAAFALFVEKHRQSAAILRRNLDTLQIVGEARIIEGDAGALTFPPPPAETQSPLYQLVFMDPPYRLLESRVPDRSVRRLLERVGGDPLVSPDAIIVVRHERQDPGAEPDLAPLVEETRRDVGTMTLRLMRRPA